MLNQDQLNFLPEQITNRIHDIQTEYMSSIGKRIKEIGIMSPSDVHKVQQLYSFGADVDDIAAKLAEVSKKNVRDIYKIFNVIAKDNYNYAKPFYEAKGITQIPYEDNEPLQRYVQAMARQTAEQYENLTQNTAFCVFDESGKMTPTSLSQTYTQTIDKATQAAQMGTIDYQSAMRKTIRNLAATGMQTVEYSSGYHRRLDSSVRQNILWGIKKCNQGVADLVGEEFGADGYEISMHSNPRPSHLEMGGKQYAIGPGRKVRGKYYPSIDSVASLLEEYGCLHFKYPILLGISRAAYSSSEIEAMKADAGKKFEFEGQKYTKYEATQKQRQLETKMRQQKDIANAAKAAGDDELRLKAQKRINQLTSKYKELSDAAGIPTKMERASVSGFRSIKVKDEIKSLTKVKSSGIMKLAADGKLDMSKYDIKDDAEAVKKAVEFIKSFHGGRIDFKALKNADVMMPFLEHTKALYEKHGEHYNAVIVDELMKGTTDIAYVNPARELHLNPDLFNSKEAIQDLLDEFLDENVIPKGCNNIRYVATHEYMHLITMDDINDIKSKARALFRRTGKKISENARHDPYEFVADYLSLPMDNAIKSKLMKYYFKEELF